LSDTTSPNLISSHRIPGSDNDSQKKKCALCGLPIGRSQATKIINGETLQFCCLGCQQVFLLLFNNPDGVPPHFRETDLYRACMESGIIPRDEKDLAFRQAQMDISEQQPSQGPIQKEGTPAQDLTLKIEGMWCSVCAWLVEEVLGKTKGIIEVRVFFQSDMAQIKYLPQFLSPQEILLKIKNLGYHASPIQDQSESSKKKKDLFLRLGISSLLTANIMMISFALYMGFFQDLTQQAIGYLSYPLGVLATPVIFYGGFPILKKAYMGLRYRSASMDTLISMGALSAYFYSLFQMARGTLHVYFDTASMLITLVLLGKYIEAQAKEEISRGIAELYRLANQKVRLWIMGKERWVSPDAVKPGDEFVVLAGERVPLDGDITSDLANIDESILTGESKPVRKKMGEEVMGGTLLLDGELRAKATRMGHESSLGQLITLMQEALSKKNPFELLSDQIMRWFVPAILVLAICTAFYLWLNGVSIDIAFLRAVTVLVITCPCALGIASPLAKVAAIGVGRIRGILIRDPEALEQAKNLNVFVFDKTGTMTTGNFSLRKVVTKSATQEEALRRVASIELLSNHFLAREVVRTAKEASLKIEEPTCFEAFEGLGVKGLVNGNEVAVGNRQFMNILKMNLPSDLEQNGWLLESKGMTTVFFGWDGQVQGFLTFGDSLKEGARKTVQELRKRGIKIWLISGDAKETTRAVAGELGIDQFLGQAFPKDKVELIKRLQNKGYQVGMVGDGFNDTASLAQADVGFALGSKANIAQEVSDITLLAEDPAKVLETLDLSALTMKVIKQNLLFAFFYNGIGIPLAVAGVLNPLVAVFAMFGSSLSVIGNTLRISRRKTYLCSSN
jgi:heavy metal translocating P-type ATPase